MNKEFLDQLPVEEQAVAQKLHAVAENLPVSQAFQSKLESELIAAHRGKSHYAPGWPTKLIPSLGWALLAVCGLFFLSWAVRSLVPGRSPAAGEQPDPEAPLATGVKTADACTGQLAAAHGFSVFLTDRDHTGFVTLDEGKEIGELRSFSWSPDGQEMAVVGNTRGSGNLYLWSPAGGPLRPVFSSSELGYLAGAAWSQDGEQLLAWQIDNNSALYFFDKDGTGLARRDLPVQFFETPQYAPDDESLLFYGADRSTSGLFQVMLDSLQARLVSALVEDETSFAWSPDGSRLAYIEMDRTLGKARLVVEDQGGKAVIAALPIPTGSGSSLPNAANLSWSPDGKALVFEFGRYASDRAVYLAYVDRTDLVQLAAPAHAPAISAGGNCLAYISKEQVFLLALPASSSSSIPAAAPVLLADLPAGRGPADPQLDKLQWQP